MALATDERRAHCTVHSDPTVQCAWRASGPSAHCTVHSDPDCTVRVARERRVGRQGVHSGAEGAAGGGNGEAEEEGEGEQGLQNKGLRLFRASPQPTPAALATAPPP